MTSANATDVILQSQSYDVDTLIQMQIGGLHNSSTIISSIVKTSDDASGCIDGNISMGMTNARGTPIVLSSVSGTVIWNQYPITLHIGIPSNAPNLFENQIISLTGEATDGVTAVGNFNSAITSYKWEVSNNGANWKTIGSVSGDSVIYSSGTENPLVINLTSDMAGLHYRATADIGPTIRNDDPVTLVSNTFTLPAIKPSYITSPAAIALGAATAHYSVSTLYIADTAANAIWKINGYKVAIFAGSATRQSGTLNGSGTNARFHSPSGIVQHNGKLYVADTENHAIRAIDADGVVTTFAGVPGQRGYVEGAGTGALFDSPKAITADTAGNLYVADAGNTIIRKITPAGVTSLVAGTPPSRVHGKSGAGSILMVNNIGSVVTGTAMLSDLMLSGSTNLVLSTTSAGSLTLNSLVTGTYALSTLTSTTLPLDLYGNYSGTITLADGSRLTVAGNVFDSGTNNTMPAPDAPYYFNSPQGLAVSPAGDALWVADTGNDAICKIDLADGSVTTQSITLRNPWAISIGFNPPPVYDTTPLCLPAGIRFAPDGDLYITDMGNSRIVKFTPSTGDGALVACTPLKAATADSDHGYRDGYVSGAAFNFPMDLAINHAGVVFVADTDNAVIRMITSGTVSTLVLEPLQTSSTTTPPTDNTSTGGSGGGGGAPSIWYLLAFVTLTALRLRQK